jgi:hypothetical protein
MGADGQVSEAELAAFERFLSLFPHGEDLTLIVLRGHLLLEEQVRLIGRERAPHSKYLEEATLTMHQAILVARAHVGDLETDAFWDALLKLNELRNRMAHQIEPKGVRDRVHHIIDLMGTESWHKEDPVQFEFALWTMFSRTLALVRKPRAELLCLVRPSAP